MQNGRYLEYNEYQKLGGNLQKKEFITLEYKASKIIDSETCGKLKKRSEQIDEVKRCEFELISILKSYSSLDEKDKGITSENIDGYTVSYDNDSEKINAEKEKKIKEAIFLYLSDCTLENGIPYLYRGARR